MRVVGLRAPARSSAPRRNVGAVLAAISMVEVLALAACSSGTHANAGRPPGSSAVTSAGAAPLTATADPSSSPSGAAPLANVPDTPLPADTVTITLPGSDPSFGTFALASDHDSIWTLGNTGIYRIGARTKDAVRVSATPVGDGDVATGDGAVWQSDYDGGFVHRIDPRTGRVVATIPIPGGTPEGIAWTPGALWVASHHGGVVARVNTVSNTVTAQIKVTEPGASGALGVAAGRTVWVGVPNSGEVARIDPASARLVGTTNFWADGFSPCGGLAVTAARVWISSCFDGTQIAELDAGTGRRIRTTDVGGGIVRCAADGDTVWFVATANPDGSDPPDGPSVLVHMGGDGAILAKYPLPKHFVSGGMVVAFGYAWAASSTTPLIIGVPVAG